jgi:ribulose-phosphate 3-epimerase
MRKGAKVSVSILSSDYFEIKKAITTINRSAADALHFDVMDGVFVNNITYGAGFVRALRPHTKKAFEVHLMLYDPLPYLCDFAEAGADAVILHAESRNFAKAFRLAKSLVRRVGIAVNPDTPFAEARKYAADADMLMIMTVEPGFGGQKFMKKQLFKIREASEWARKSGRNLAIQVDGGIDFSTAKAAVAAGADSLVSGSFLFAQKDFAAAVRALKES